jgi:hypothetical protein
MSTFPKDAALRENPNYNHLHLFQDYGPNESQVIYETHDVGDKSFTMPAHQWTTRNIVHRNVIMPPQTSISSSLLVNGGRVDFQIEKDFYNVRSMYIELTVTNTSADTAQKLSPVYMLFDNIKLISGGKTEFINMSGLDLYTAATTFMTNAQIAAEGILTNLSTAWVANTTIATGASTTYYLPLLDLFPKDGNDNGFPLFNARQMKLELLFKGSDSIETNSSAGMANH